MLSTERSVNDIKEIHSIVCLPSLPATGPQLFARDAFLNGSIRCLNFSLVQTVAAEKGDENAG